MALHDAAMKDEYFIKRKLAPNVDFWYVLPIIVTSFSLDADASSMIAGGERDSLDCCNMSPLDSGGLNSTLTQKTKAHRAGIGKT